MIDLTRQVSELRDILAKEQKSKKGLMAIWEAANDVLLTEIAFTSLALAEAEAALREAGLAKFLATGDKAPFPGVAIKMITRLTYDPVAAKLWGYKHEMALKLDVVAFEKMAKAGPLDFVVITQEPQCQIAQDLSKVLAQLLPAQG